MAPNKFVVAWYLSGFILTRQKKSENSNRQTEAPNKIVKKSHSKNSSQYSRTRNAPHIYFSAGSLSKEFL